jgi:sugar phosphate isomerase/epimerase
VKTADAPPVTTLALSTRWNAHRHRDGQAMLDAICALGFRHVELGYDLTIDLVPGVRARVADGTIVVDSVHNFCPVPVGAPRGHPELFQLASRDAREREAAVRHTLRTIELAGELGARAVVVHAGNVVMRRLTGTLLDMLGSGRRYTPRYERTRMKLLTRRARAVPKHLDALSLALEALLPRAEDAGVRLALENLPSWESLPTESELVMLFERFPSPALAAWHDIGHARVRENLGLIGARNWLERLAPHVAGFHVHDVRAPAHDHLMPPRGEIDFAPFRPFVRSGIVAVLEPAPATPQEEIRAAVCMLESLWGDGEETA